MENVTLDLAKLSGFGRVKNLSGKERGIAARRELGVDELDKVAGQIDVQIPDYVDVISPSYFQGLFSQSIRSLNGAENFLQKYKFNGSQAALRWVQLGIRNATSSREPLI